MRIEIEYQSVGLSKHAMRRLNQIGHFCEKTDRRSTITCDVPCWPPPRETMWIKWSLAVVGGNTQEYVPTNQEFCTRLEAMLIDPRVPTFKVVRVYDIDASYRAPYISTNKIG